MSRRPQLRILAISLVALVTLSACGSTAANEALNIDGKSISDDTLNMAITQLAEAGQLTLENGVASGDASRSVLGAMLRGKGTELILEQYGEAVTDADRKLVTDQVTQDAGFDTLGKELQTLIIELNSADLALARIKAPSEADVATMYESAAASVGTLCVQHILVKEEATAKEVLQKLNDGATFKSTAGEYSIEPNASETGGVLGSVDGDCILLTDYQTQFDIDFVKGVLTAKTGVATGPIKSSFGYHVVLIRPFDDVKASLLALLEKTPGEMLLNGLLATQKVTVASEYGIWNPASGKIVAS
jgi:parvulin-like peptidyl-prolyl isomerase